MSLLHINTNNIRLDAKFTHLRCAPLFALSLLWKAYSFFTFHILHDASLFFDSRIIFFRELEHYIRSNWRVIEN